MDRLIYSKFSNERNSKYAIETSIVENDSARWVCKKPLYEEGKQHFENMKAAYLGLTTMFPKGELAIQPYEEADDGIPPHPVLIHYILVSGQFLHIVDEFLAEDLFSVNEISQLCAGAPRIDGQEPALGDFLCHRVKVFVFVGGPPSATISRQI